MTALLGHIDTLLATIAAADPRWIALALVLQLGNLCARSLAWRNVLAAAFETHRFGVASIGRAYAIGIGLNGWLPARGGDAAKVAIVRAQHPGTNAVAIASSSIVLVAFDSLVAAALLVVAVASGALPSPPLGSLTSTAGSSAPLVALAVLGIAVGVYALRGLATGLLRRAREHARQGLAVLASPLRWARTVLSVQLLAWSCRIGVAYCMLVAFGIPATPQLAALVVVAGGMSTLVPVPGGAGTQQALAAVVLAGVAPASQAITFSVAMQLGVTAVNTTIAILAAMIAFGHLHPLKALRAAAAASRGAAVREPLPDAVG